MVEVCAIVVTYRRPETLRHTLRAIEEQTSPACQVIVVDNDADPSVQALLVEHHPTTRYVSSLSNVGYGAALAMGMRVAQTDYNPEWYWLLDDDTPPDAAALESARSVAATDAHAWVVANRGGRIVLGRIRHGFADSHKVNRADFTLVDGALISRKAVVAAGFPRSDLFMMLEDFDYTTRIADNGGLLLVRPARSTALLMGSSSTWRSYYQSRNHLRIAIERKSPAWIFGWGSRTLGLCLVDLKRGRWPQLRFRLIGAWDAVCNRMGSERHPWLVSNQ